MIKKKLLPSILVLLVSVMICSNVAHAEIIRLPVTRREQLKSNWCWAATAQMFGELTTDNSYTQTAICIHVKGSSVNETATYSEVTKAIKYTTGKPVTSSGQLYYAIIQYEIKSTETPIAIRMQWSSSLLNGHILLVTGVDTDTQELRLTDPAEGCGSRWYYYDDLCDGTTIQSGTGYFNAAWTI